MALMLPASDLFAGFAVLLCYRRAARSFWGKGRGGLGGGGSAGDGDAAAETPAQMAERMARLPDRWAGFGGEEAEEEEEEDGYGSESEVEDYDDDDEDFEFEEDVASFALAGHALGEEDGEPNEREEGATPQQHQRSHAALSLLDVMDGQLVYLQASSATMLAAVRRGKDFEFAAVSKANAGGDAMAINPLDPACLFRIQRRGDSLTFSSVGANGRLLQAPSHKSGDVRLGSHAAGALESFLVSGGRFVPVGKRGYPLPYNVVPVTVCARAELVAATNASRQQLDDLANQAAASANAAQAAEAERGALEAALQGKAQQLAQAVSERDAEAVRAKQERVVLAERLAAAEAAADDTAQELAEIRKEHEALLGVFRGIGSTVDSALNAKPSDLEAATKQMAWGLPDERSSPAHSNVGHDAPLEDSAQKLATSLAEKLARAAAEAEVASAVA